MSSAYDEKCDVFSFSMVMWELFAQKLDPFEEFNEQGSLELKIASNPQFRPNPPSNTATWIIDMMQRCWSHEAAERPSFVEIASILDEAIAKQ